jgi:hypothetical protein
MLEKDIEKYLCGQVKKICGWAVKFASPGLRGVPDRIVMLPGGRIVFVELKAPWNKLRKLQTHVCDKIRGFGFDVRCIDTKEKVDAFVREIGNRVHEKAKQNLPDDVERTCRYCKYRHIHTMSYPCRTCYNFANPDMFEKFVLAEDVDFG